MAQELLINKKNRTDRLKHFDFISGVFIIQIIVMHILQFSNRYCDNSIFDFVMQISFFFMPWFYFKSGFFYTQPTKIDFYFIKSKFQKLLVPFAIFGFIGFCINLPYNILTIDRPFLENITSPIIGFLREGSVGFGNAPLWFLLSLFIVNILYAYFDIIKAKYIIIIFPFLGFSLYYFNIKLPLGLSNLFLATFFFGAGSLVRKYMYLVSYRIVIVINLVLYLLLISYAASYIDFRSNNLVNGHYLVYSFSAIVGLILVSGGLTRFSGVRIVNKIGSNSLLYFILHWPLILTCRLLLYLLGISTLGYHFAAITFFVIFISIPLLSSVSGRVLSYRLFRSK
ncbi:acyltransferase family protein [Labilibacter marinus]|uniref:acyltransferase family protein n=1 Tax=Labilibacter marinus TaxID=1477105 RepID=UPI0008345CA7